MNKTALEYAHALKAAKAAVESGEFTDSDLELLGNHAKALAEKYLHRSQNFLTRLADRQAAKAAAIKGKVEAAQKKIEDKIREIVDSCPEIFESFHTRRYGLVLQKEDDTTKWPKGYSILWTPINATMTIVTKPEKATKTTEKSGTPAGTEKVSSLNFVK